MSFPNFIYRQLFVSIPKPTASYAGQTVIVTGSNVGLGKEAARHFAQLNAARVILAVRSLDKGEDAKKDIESTAKCGPNVVHVWQLDLQSYESVKQFAARCERELDRVDILLENAGIVTKSFKIAEQDESTITTNVVSTFLLALLILPKLKETASKYNVRPVLTIVSSDVHYFTQFPEKSSPDGQIFTTLSTKEKANMDDRYNVSKLLEVLIVKKLAELRPVDSYPVTINTINPGLCHSELTREGYWSVWLLKLLLARTTEVGGRTLVDAATQGPETHGKYLSECRITQPSDLVRSKEGEIAKNRVWDELVKKLEAIQPGVVGNL